MKQKAFIWLLMMVLGGMNGIKAQSLPQQLEFYGDTISISFSNKQKLSFEDQLSHSSIKSFYNKMEEAGLQLVIAALKKYMKEHQPDDWLFYQLIRKAAQELSPKNDNYQRYTLYKWYFLLKTGYETILTIHRDKILMYVQSNEIIYEIPYRVKNEKQFICLNYHDYGRIDFEKEIFEEVATFELPIEKVFSYRITRLPGFDKSSYKEKDISFTYNESRYSFKIRINPEVKTIFANYPVVDYEKYFNIPLSNDTYTSLIPSLKKVLNKMSKVEGVEYLMYFTRYAFVYKADSEIFGKEKRLSPEQTLLFDYSDCEDRAALFFYLVKEIYNLPMIVVAFPEHVNIAVKFDKPIGESIVYNGDKYSFCEPTPQAISYKIGQVDASLLKKDYHVVYAYQPHN